MWWLKRKDDGDQSDDHDDKRQKPDESEDGDNGAGNDDGDNGRAPNRTISLNAGDQYVVFVGAREIQVRGGSAGNLILNGNIRITDSESTDIFIGNPEDFVVINDNEDGTSSVMSFDGLAAGLGIPSVALYIEPGASADNFINGLPKLAHLMRFSQRGGELEEAEDEEEDNEDDNYEDTEDVQESEEDEDEDDEEKIDENKDAQT